LHQLAVTHFDFDEVAVKQVAVSYFDLHEVVAKDVGVKQVAVSHVVDRLNFGIQQLGTQYFFHVTAQICL
jgi:hypothetical protein